MTAVVVSEQKALRGTSLVMYGAGVVTGCLGIKGVFRLFQNDLKGLFLSLLLVVNLGMTMVLTGFALELLARFYDRSLDGAEHDHRSTVTNR
jgi:hypothetical protein